MTSLSLIANGEKVEVDVPPRTSLADLFRENLRFTGINVGCEQGVCGSCTVLVDGMPVRSCLIPAISCEGQDVRSIEGLEDDEIINLLRDAFKREHGLQCGLCFKADSARQAPMSSCRTGVRGYMAFKEPRPSYQSLVVRNRPTALSATNWRFDSSSRGFGLFILLFVRSPLHVVPAMRRKPSLTGIQGLWLLTLGERLVEPPPRRA